MKTKTFTKLCLSAIASIAISLAGYSQTYNYFVGSDFESDTLNATYWLPFQEGTNATATFSYETTNPLNGSKSYKVKMTSATTDVAVWMIQLTQFATVHKGAPIALKFKAKASTAATFAVEFCQEYAPFNAAVYNGSISVGTTMQEYTVTGIPNYSQGTYKMDFLLGTLPVGATLWLDDVELVQTDSPWDLDKMPNGQFDEYDDRSDEGRPNYFSGWDGGFLDFTNGLEATIGIDHNSVLSGENSLHLTMTTTSGNFWEVQATAFYTGYPGEIYEVSFITSSVGISSTMSVYDENDNSLADGFRDPILASGDFEVPVGKSMYSFTTSGVTKRTDRWFHFFLGTSPSGTDLYIDSVVIKRIATKVAETPTGIGSPDIESSLFSIYPNPSVDGSISIDLGKLKSDAIVSIVDLHGRTLHSKSAKAASLISLDANLSSGFYFVKVHSGGKTSIKKLLVK